MTKKATLKTLEKALKKVKRKPTPRCGVIHPRCPKCGGVVYHYGRGVIIERCSKCGKTYHEPRIA